MTAANTDVLISGASVAGPVLAYWLRRHGLTPTVVERAPAPRRTGGHAVDLFRPAVDVAERMGVLPEIEAMRTTTRVVSLVTGDGGRPVDIDVERLMAAASGRHVEIMRDDLAEILYQRTRHDVEYVFGDSIESLDEDAGGVTATFEKGPPRRFHLVAGADGLHSTVRRLRFGDERDHAHHSGAYLAVFSLPNHFGLERRMLAYSGAGKAVAVYAAGRDAEARAVFLFRRPTELRYGHRDVERQKALLREAFAGDGWHVPLLLKELEHAPAFYFDSITQIRMDTWSRGRVTLVGDAGYSPGPAVGGGTTLAAVGAYVLAGELKAAGGDHRRAFPAYEAELREYVLRTREAGMGAVRKLMPCTRFQARAQAQAGRLFGLLPVSVSRGLLALQRRGAYLHDAVRLKDYEG
ncbi:FAD-dependent monooxygenase [Sphaerisporangium sp. TRM90804]|uniref:FAD-dependent monooxygenase n=1 Tax=Sphaerisporangium sp. TRM90804 TaxID=3031113 RepID=UPI002449E850|nr:FAD-dependent monooxygenase [Sphaerisporangium sp. TRM90804]MDH2427721.1 FAD-dependent monooxygenase [Sphaerisporangium sp. TRM90804]